MAIQRPLKEGSVRTYQQKVALNYLDILASEMDADLDTIYAAWNGGVGTGDIQNGTGAASTAVTPGVRDGVRKRSLPRGFGTTRGKHL